MSREIYYKHCRLEKVNSTQHTWLPEEFAKVGKVVKLRGDDGEWVDGWVVREVGENRLAEKSVPDYHSLIKGHRQATGDALPKNT